MTDFRYRGFISYSWADAAWGNWLHNALEIYRTPKALVGTDGAYGPVAARLNPLFKDREEEAAGTSINAAVEAALASSEFLIVVCSPRSAQSRWVNHEIAWFKTHRDPTRVIALIVDGEPGSAEAECFPAALTHKILADLSISDELEDNPLAADARDSGDGKRRAKLKLAAAMLGVGLDQLARRDERRRTIQTRIVVGASLSLTTVMSGLTWFAIEARNEAQIQRGQAEGLVEFMIDDLRTNLQPKVQIEVLGSIADRATAFYAVQGKYAMDDEALARRSRVLKLLADLEADRGRSSQSLALLRQSIAASGELLKRDPDNPDRILEQAFALQGLGNVSFQRGQLQIAEDLMQQAVDLTTHLVTDVGRNDEWMAEHGTALGNLGVVQLQQNQGAQARVNFDKAIAIKRKTIRMDDRTHAGWMDFAITLAWAAQAAERLGKFADAQQLRSEEQRVYGRMLDDDDGDQVAASALTVSKIKAAEALLLQNSVVAALAVARDATARAEKSLAADPGNFVMVEDAAGAALTLALAELQSKNAEASEIAANRAMGLAVKLVADEPSVINWNGNLLGNARLTSYAARARALTGAACQSALEPIAAEARRLEKLRTAYPGDRKLALATSRSQLMRGDAGALAGDIAAAKASWGEAAATLASLYGAIDKIVDPAGRLLVDQLRMRSEQPRTPLARGVVCA